MASDRRGLGASDVANIEDVFHTGAMIDQLTGLASLNIAGQK